MRHVLVAVGLLLGTLGSLASAAVQVSVGFSVPGLTIGINLPAYPYLVLVPGYPVYYAPRLASPRFELLLLRWPVLGLRRRQLVRELLVQRPLGNGLSGLCAVVHSAGSRLLLSLASAVFPQLVARRTAALGRTLGKGLGAPPHRVEPVGHELGAGTRALAGLPARVFRDSLSDA